MNKIKSQLILYRPSRHLDNPGACIKKRLYLSKFEFCEERRSFAQAKKISKAQITKYIRRTHWNFIHMLQTQHVNVNTFHFFTFNLNLCQISVKGDTGFDEFSIEERRFVKRLFRQQKRLAKCKVELFTNTLEEIRFEGLFQVRSLKNFELEIVQSAEEDLVLLKGFLQNVQRKKPWIATGVQKIKLELSPIFERFDTMNDSDDEDEVNEFFVQYFEKLLALKDLVKETCTQLTLILDIHDVRAKVRKETWTLFAKMMKEVENIVEIQYIGEPEKEFATVLKGLKDSKELKRLDFGFYHNENKDYRDILWESFESIGESLKDLTIQMRNLESKKDWLPKLERVPRLESLCLSGSVMQFDQRFFFQLSDYLKVMTELRNLNIMLTLDVRDTANRKVPNVKQLLETIGGLVKLENLSFLLLCYSGTFIVDGMKNEVLCEPLMNLKSLKSLDYSFLSVNGGGNEMKQFLMVLSEMKQLKKLSLRFSYYEKLEDQNLISIFKVIAQMKWLQRLDFQFGCSEITNEFLEVFIEAMKELRCLEEVDLSIFYAIENIKIEKDLKGICKQLEIEKRIPIRLTTGLGQKFN